MAPEKIPHEVAAAQGAPAGTSCGRRYAGWCRISWRRGCARIGAESFEPAGERLALRNGHRPRPWDTQLGSLALTGAKWSFHRLSARLRKRKQMRAQARWRKASTEAAWRS